MQTIDYFMEVGEKSDWCRECLEGLDNQELPIGKQRELHQKLIRAQLGKIYKDIEAQLKAIASHK